MKNETKTPILLLDTLSLLHRAYYAIPDLSTKDGKPTGALYGIANTLIKLKEEYNPRAFIACYDLKAPTHRHDVYEGYKAGRQELDEDLILQIEESRRVFESFGALVRDAEGYEADDIIGAFAVAYAKKKVPVVIVTGDKDLFQLVQDPFISVWYLKKGTSTIQHVHEKDVGDICGVHPTLIPDLKGIAGDPSDNIQGVRGVGEKTAVILIQKFGGLEKVYEALKGDEDTLLDTGIQKRMIRFLKDGRKDAFFSRSLATISTDVPLSPPDIENTPLKPQLQNFLSLLDEFEFGSLKKRIIGKGMEGEQQESVDEELLLRATIALWVLDANHTKKDIQEIYHYTNKKILHDAYNSLLSLLKENEGLWYIFNEVELPLIPIIASMKEVGIKVRKDTLDRLEDEYTKCVTVLEKEIHTLAGREFNVNSPKQLGEILFDVLDLKGGGVKRSTREGELIKLKGTHPIIEKIQEYREIKKLLSTYIKALKPLIQKDGKVHADFLQYGTTTGRLSSKNPNLQNIPTRTERGRKVKKAFVPVEGKVFVALDYSQIEMRIAAYLSQDAGLIDLLKDGDVHTQMGTRIFSIPPEKITSMMRKKVKAISYGILYGMGIRALKASMGEHTTEKEARAFYDEYAKAFPKLMEYRERSIGRARVSGYTETLFGRRRPLTDINSSIPFVRSHAERVAINSPIQGTQADIIKLAMIQTAKKIKDNGHERDAQLIIQIHDELLFEISEGMEESTVPYIQMTMEHVAKEKGLHFPVEVKSGKSWLEV